MGLHQLVSDNHFYLNQFHYFFHRIWIYVAFLKFILFIFCCLLLSFWFYQVLFASFAIKGRFFMILTKKTQEKEREAKIYKKMKMKKVKRRGCIQKRRKQRKRKQKIFLGLFKLYCFNKSLWQRSLCCFKNSIQFLSCPFSWVMLYI